MPATIAELGVLALELRNSRSALSRAQLAALAERARDDAGRLTGCTVAPIAVRSHEPVAPSGAEIIPLFGR